MTLEFGKKAGQVQWTRLALGLGTSIGLVCNTGLTGGPFLAHSWNLVSLAHSWNLSGF
jgi:hypothetical protein